MSSIAEKFIETTTEKSFDIPHRGIINHNIGKYDVAVEKGLSRLINLEYAKKKSHLIKWKVMENLDKMLPEFEGGEIV